MKHRLEPIWPKSQVKAGQKMSQAWDEFFSAAEDADDAGKQEASRLSADARIDEVMHRHESELLGRANVVGVARGQRVRQGQPREEPCITVYVGRKVPEKDLGAADRLPREIEGVPVDVVEVGELKPL